MSTPPPTQADPPDHARSIIAGAAKLAGSLVVSFGISVAVRNYLIPRTLGTEHYGELNFCDGFAQLFLVVSAMGIDTWLRKELGVTVRSANGIFGGVLLVRAVMTTALIALMGVVLTASGRSMHIVAMASVFAVGQFMVYVQQTASALLHAAGAVGGLSIVNIVGKVLWAAAVLPALYLDLPLIWLAVAYAGAETIKTVGTMALARAHTGLDLSVDLKATWRALRASMPFWMNAIALAGTGRADVAVLGTLSVGLLGSQAAANREVGWYTVVIGLAGMLMVVAPVVSWVLLPLLSRALLRSPDDAAAIIRRAIEATVVLGMAVSVGMFVAADELIGLYKAEYGPSGLVLKIMAFTFVLTYLNVVAANCLVALGRGWTVTLTSLATLVLAPALDLVTVPFSLGRFGPGAGAAACACSIVVVETLTTSLMLRNLGSSAVDARLRSVVARTALTVAGVIALDLVLRRQGVFSWGRVALDAVAYVALALATRSVRVAEARQLIRLVRARRKAAEA